MKLGLREDGDLPDEVEDSTPEVWAEPDEALYGDKQEDEKDQKLYSDRLMDGFV